MGVSAGAARHAAAAGRWHGASSRRKHRRVHGDAELFLATHLDALQQLLKKPDLG
jgi:hypothetical protein